MINVKISKLTIFRESTFLRRLASSIRLLLLNWCPYRRFAWNAAQVRIRLRLRLPVRGRSRRQARICSLLRLEPRQITQYRLKKEAKLKAETETGVTVGTGAGEVAGGVEAARGAGGVVAEADLTRGIGTKEGQEVQGEGEGAKKGKRTSRRVDHLVAIENQPLTHGRLPWRSNLCCNLKCMKTCPCGCSRSP